MMRLLGLDYGLRRVGAAWGTSAEGLAFAVGTHVEGRDGSIFAWLDDLIAAHDITEVVVGLPLTADGRESDIALRARKFADRLADHTGLPVTLWDERFSSAEADRWLAVRKSPSKEDRDALAAAIILQSYLDSLRAGGPVAPPEET